MENFQHQLEEKDTAIERANQSKKKAQQDNEDLNIELENLRASNRELEKRQKKFDQLLAEERANVQKVGILLPNMHLRAFPLYDIILYYQFWMRN